MDGTPDERRAALRGWLDGLTADPPQGLDKAKEFLELAGDLFDDEHLDGDQYAAVYDVGRALKSPGTTPLADVARRALKRIP